MHHILSFTSGIVAFIPCATDSSLTFLFFQKVLCILWRNTWLCDFFNISTVNFNGRRWHPFLFLFDLQLLISFRNRCISLAKWNFKGRPRCLHIVIRYIIVCGSDVKKEQRTAASRVVGGNGGWSGVNWLAWVWWGRASQLRLLPTVSFALEVRYRRSIRIH